MTEKEKIKRFMHDLGNALVRFNEVMEVSIEENDLALDAAIQRWFHVPGFKIHVILIYLPGILRCGISRGGFRSW